MLSLSPATRVFLALDPIDGRKSFNGLTTLVKESLGQEPTSGFLFAFINKARNRLKILFWDGSGLILCTKRLERGTFAPIGQLDFGASGSAHCSGLASQVWPPGGVVGDLCRARAFSRHSLSSG